MPAINYIGRIIKELPGAKINTGYTVYNNYIIHLSNTFHICGVTRARFSLCYFRSDNSVHAYYTSANIHSKIPECIFTLILSKSTLLQKCIKICAGKPAVLNDEFAAAENHHSDLTVINQIANFMK